MKETGGLEHQNSQVIYVAKEIFGFTFADLAFLTLGAASLSLAVAAVLIGGFAFFGYRNIRKRADKVAKQSVKKELEDLDLRIQEHIDRLMYGELTPEYKDDSGSDED